MTIATESDLINARANKRQNFGIQKASLANAIAGAIFSMWRSTGPLSAQGAIPGAAAVPDSTTLGAQAAFTNPGGADKTYLDDMSVSCTNAGRVILVDRLIHNGNLSGTVTTAQAVNTPALPATRAGNTTGVGLEWYLEWYTDTGATAVTATVTYTNQAGTAGRTTTVSLTATMRAGRILPITPQAGDTAIQSIQSVTLSATTGTAGAFGVSCYRRLKDFTVPTANVGVDTTANLVEIINSACLAVLVECSTTTTGDVRGVMSLVQG